MLKLKVYDEDNDETTEIKFPSTSGTFESIITAILDNNIELLDESFIYTSGQKIELNKTYYFQNNQIIKIRNPLNFEDSSIHCNKITISLIKKLKLIHRKGRKWRNIKEGINLFGKCNNENCEAFEKEVIQHIKQEHYILETNHNQMNCPICDSICYIHFVGFYKCYFNIYREVYKKNSEVEKFDQVIPNFSHIPINSNNQVIIEDKNITIEKVIGENIYKFDITNEDKDIDYSHLIFQIQYFK